jgi:hypothetical protein
MECEIVTFKEAATMIGVSILTLREWVRRELAPQPMRLGAGSKRTGMLVYRRREVEELIRVRKELFGK